MKQQAQSLVHILTVTMANIKKGNEESTMSSREKLKLFRPLLPAPPERPLDSDCCGSGCVPCVMDIYREELSLWEAECERIQASLRTAGVVIDEQKINQEVKLHPSNYAEFTIQNIQQEGIDSIRIRCGLPRNQTLGLLLGQHIIIRSRSEDLSLTRKYTPVSPLNARGYFELIIKIYLDGRMSERVKTWSVGDKLEARGPFGYLAYVRNKFQRVVMLCAGTGVAPMCQVIDSVLADDADETCLRLVYACSTYKHIMARSEIEEWRRFWNFSCHYVLSQEPASPTHSYKTGDEISLGHINKEIVLKELGSITDSVLVLICGTRSFDEDMIVILKELGVSETNVHKY